ncbi:hypothetical protein B0A48_02234 [Cryoendolithus antarcticus]|uniref:LisH domain-containing protein n=1 Tax=Cryoendolithus antarcticus TaxID=1507870 RepID=A0A1V8TN37_9PEZI|nr:hypothetical protein B0A48_02234 [Cryoendolithus antarcticus]
MPASDSPAIIVARYLRANGLNESYDAFIAEAGLPADAGTVGKGDLTLEVLLEEKKAFDLSAQFEKLATDDGDKGWSEPSPSTVTEIDDLPSSSNILQVAIAPVKYQGEVQPLLLVSTADRRLSILDGRSAELRMSWTTIQDAPILSTVPFRDTHLLVSSMSGQLVLVDMTGQVVEKRRDHTKYVVQIAISQDTDHPLIATAGWDNKVNIYSPSLDLPPKIGEPTASITLPTKPESILFLQHPDSDEPILVLSRTDSSHLHYYTTSSPPRYLGRQNLAPHSNAWVSFTPSSMSICPTDPTLVAVATSAVPSMKLLIARLLIPSWEGEPILPNAELVTLRTSLLDDNPNASGTQASQARAALLVADREHAAILIHCTTLAPQTAYSTPAVVWRPDGSGVWVNGDDGVIRGIEVSTGKIVATLKGHEPGSKVRCLWAGEVAEKEVLVSGGFDQKLIRWEV